MATDPPRRRTKCEDRANPDVERVPLSLDFLKALRFAREVTLKVNILEFIFVETYSQVQAINLGTDINTMISESGLPLCPRAF
eukprot:g17022.t1